MTVYYGDFRKTDSKGRILLSNERTLQELKEQEQELGVNLLDGDTLVMGDKSIPGVIVTVHLTPDNEWVGVVDWDEVSKCL